MASSLQNSITEEYVGIIKSFKSIPKEFKDKDIKSIARKAAKPIREHAERLTPEYKKGTEHYRLKISSVRLSSSFFIEVKLGSINTLR